MRIWHFVSGVHVVMYRRPDDKDIDSWKWYGNNDLVNPYRDRNITIDEIFFVRRL